MYTDIQPLRGSDAHTSVMYTTENIHIWSMLLVSHVIMYVHNVKATPRGKLRIHIQVSYPYMVNAVV